MSRTTLITNSFIFFSPPTQFPFSFTLAYPSHLQYTGFRYSSCAESLCGQMCAWTFLFLRNLKGTITEDPLTPENECQGLGRWVVSRRSPEPPPSAVYCPSKRPNVPFPGGGGTTKCHGGGWVGGIVLRCNCLVSCKINTFLYIFREQKKCCYKVQNVHSEHFSKTNDPKEAFWIPRSHLWVCKRHLLVGHLLKCKANFFKAEKQSDSSNVEFVHSNTSM